jgi:hypothetical protein
VIVVFSRQVEVSSRVAATLQSFLGWRAVACARRPTVEVPLWQYHLDAVTGLGDSIVYGWPLPNVLAEGEAVMPPNFLRRWCREVLVRGGFVLHAEPQLDESAATDLPADVVKAEHAARKRCFDLLNGGLQGLPWSLLLSLDEDELELRAREANGFFQLARRYEAANSRWYGCGSLAPRVVLVGEASLPGVPPFGALGGCSAYLGDILDGAQLQEGELHLLNAANLRGEPTDHAVLNVLRPEVLVLLGKRAAEWWEARGGQLVCEERMSVVRFDHPQHLKRFHHGEVIEHARRLTAALERARAGERAIDARVATRTEEDEKDGCFLDSASET